MFYYGDWRHPQDNQLKRLDAAVSQAFGAAVYPQVEITAPASDGAVWPIEQPLDVSAAVSGHEAAIEAAWFRLDGGPWTAISPGDTLSIDSLALSELAGIAPGCHELTILVRDALGRPGQDVRVLALE